MAMVCRKVENSEWKGKKMNWNRTGTAPYQDLYFVLFTN